MTPQIESQISTICERFRAQFAPIEFTHHQVSAFGRTFLRVHKCPFRAVYQLVIQLACRLYYGYNPPSWETISVACFQNGWVDWIQAVSPVVNEFCTAAADPNVRLAEQRRLFFAAANAHVNAMTRIARGQGFKAHLHALYGVLRDNEDLPLMFMDPTREQTRVQSTKIVKTDYLEGLSVQEMAFLMAEPDCIFLHYEIGEERYVTSQVAQEPSF